MSAEVWISGVKSTSIGEMQGLRAKFFGHDWEEPTHIVPPLPAEAKEPSKRHNDGLAIAREEFPEASYVFSQRHFKKVKDLFITATFFLVKERLASALRQVDLGAGGLFPYTIYKDDKVTPLEEKFWLLNFGCQKDSFRGEASKNVTPMIDANVHGIELWRTNMGEQDGDIAVTSVALEGADLWFEPKLWGSIFMSGQLVEAIKQAGVDVDLRLKKCRIVEGAA